MTTNDFDYYLPERLIAQTPIYPRSASRLLLIDRLTGSVSHKNFIDILDVLQTGDCLILNDSRVIPARLHGSSTQPPASAAPFPPEGVYRGHGGGDPGQVPCRAKASADAGTRASVPPNPRKIEVLLLRQIAPNEWECLTRPGKKTREGVSICFEGGLTARVLGELDDGIKVLSFDGEITVGEMPLPPYIHEKQEDSERYQTIYAREPGSAAAPTAGLHFTDEVLDGLKTKGVALDYITLHVGLGTFRPVQTENISDHKMHTEYYTIPQSTVDTVARTKQNGGRVIAVGTTTCRALESRAISGGVSAGSGSTDIFITPGYDFKVMDGLITNFHLPKSTLIMLVSAFAGRENILNAYQAAVYEEYRFFSFGDCMLIL